MHHEEFFLGIYLFAVQLEATVCVSVHLKASVATVETATEVAQIRHGISSWVNTTRLVGAGGLWRWWCGGGQRLSELVRADADVIAFHSCYWFPVLPEQVFAWDLKHPATTLSTFAVL